MSAGPLRRVVAAIGLITLAPIASMLVQGALTPEAAAQRALAIGLVVIVLGNLARRVVTGCVIRLERRSVDGPDDGGGGRSAAEPEWAERAAS